MGKVEKVIVLSVLFLVALILVVTVTVDDPLDKSNVVEAGAKKGAPAVAQAPAAAPTSGAPLLNSTIVAPTPAAAGTTPQAGAPAPGQVPPAVPTGGGAAAPGPTGAPAAGTAQSSGTGQPAGATALPPGALLKRLDGLEDSWFPDFKLYTWKEGDTWRTLANTYYGDWQRLDVLKRHNEGRMDVQPGDKVFVPVFAEERPLVGAPASVAADDTIPATSAGSAMAKPAPVSQAGVKNGSKSAPKASGKKFHTVANGESLWKIAKAELGDGNRWKEIYDANRDLLDKPESIKKGMRLRIP